MQVKLTNPNLVKEGRIVMSLPGTILILAKTSGTRYCRQTQGAVCSTVRVAALDLHFLKHSCLQLWKILWALLLCNLILIEWTFAKWLNTLFVI